MDTDNNSLKSLINEPSNVKPRSNIPANNEPANNEPHNNEPHNNEPHNNETIFKIDHMVVIHGEPMHKILIKLAMWFAVLWVCIIVIIYIIDTPTKCSAASYKMLDFPNERDQYPRSTEQLIILYNDDGQGLY
jgi:hypothetical protein